MVDATRNKKLVGAPGIAARSKDATIGALGLTTRNKKLLGARSYGDETGLTVTSNSWGERR